MRAVPILLAVLLSVGACATDGGTASTGIPSTEPSDGGETDRPRAEPAERFEDCAALTRYLSDGGFSHDDTYDPTSDALTVYGEEGRQFLLTPRDADCISASRAVSTRVRDAVRTAQDVAPGAARSRLLAAASSSRPRLVPDEQAPVPADLQRLAAAFVRYAAGDSDTFPHGDPVSMAIGGETVLYLDDVAAAVSNRGIWRICPADWEVYGASSCPVDLLGPITEAAANAAVLVASADHDDDVTCAPPRTGPLPQGRLVVLRPTEEWRTCASDFALVLAADEHGRLTGVDLTLAAP